MFGNISHLLDKGWPGQKSAPFSDTLLFPVLRRGLRFDFAGISTSQRTAEYIAARKRGAASASTPTSLRIAKRFF